MRTADPELRQRRREQILEAAGRCFVDKGFHQSSMAEIAAASGLSMGLLYRYFRNKDDLVLAFAERERAESIAALDALQAASLQAGVSAYLAHALNAIFDVHYVRIATEILAESGRNPGLLERLRREDALAMDALRATLGNLRANGLIAAPATNTHLATLLTASLEGLAIRALLDPALDRQSLQDDLLEQWLRMLNPSPGDGQRNA
jgi:AcrR family transcriptional regulator